MQPQHMPALPLEGRVRYSRVSLPVINVDRLRAAKALVDKAVKERKIFSVQGPYPVIRAALRERGWVERRVPRPSLPEGHRHRDQQTETDEAVDSSDDDGRSQDRGAEEEKEDDHDDLYKLMSRLVRNETTNFYWTTRRDTVDCRSLRKDQMTNHYAKAGSFTTKVGLCMSLRNLQWFDAADPDSFFPRCYRLGAEDEKQAFIEDFRQTACTSLLQHVVETYGGEGDTRTAETLAMQQFHNSVKQCKRQASQRVGPGLIDRALHVCQDYLNSVEHCDIDIATETPPTLSEQQWAEFLQSYYLVVHDGVRIECGREYVECCRSMLGRVQRVFPQLETDGLHNIWIIKPGAKSRGRGIVCMKRLDEILRLVDGDPTLIKDSKWVVQKYLERPLLVHDTKFDLRQWFLVTDWNPLTVWFYRECYLRFSTQPYSTHTLDSSVHLCNNSIQKHFVPSAGRDPSLPAECMWSCAEFRAWLASRGQAMLWDRVVVPGMERAVIHTLLTAQDSVEPRRASFELYGADFMLGRDLRPWLLEVNASPTMAPSTGVTARLCPAVQRDTLRVVLDRRTDPGTHTGAFELIFKQAAVEVPPYVGVNLLVEGAPIRRPRPLPHKPLYQSECKPFTKPANQRPSQAMSSCPSGKENHSKGVKRRSELVASGHWPTLSSRKGMSERTLTFHAEPGRQTQRLPLPSSSLSFTRSMDQRLHNTHTQPSQTHCHFRRPRRNLPSIYRPNLSLEIVSLQPTCTLTETSHTHAHTQSQRLAHSTHPILRMHQYISQLHRHNVATYRDQEGPQSS